MNPDSPGKPERRHEGEADERRVERHLAREPAELADVARVGAVVDDADQREEHRR